MCTAGQRFAPSPTYAAVPSWRSSPTSTAIRPLRSPSPWTERGIRTRPDRTPRCARASTASAVRARAPAGPAGSRWSASVATRPKRIGVPDAATNALPVPAYAAPIRSIRATSLSTVSSNSAKSSVKARWATASARSASATIRSWSLMSPRTAVPPRAVILAAEASERARPTTSWPAATSSCVRAVPIQPDAPVMKTRMVSAPCRGLERASHVTRYRHSTTLM